MAESAEPQAERKFRILGLDGGGISRMNNISPSHSQTASGEKQGPKPVRDFSKIVPELGLPKTSGTIKGIGEKFSLSPATGSGSASIPIATTAARGAPELAISYDSGSGNGSFGMGWSLGLSAITRKTEKRLPTYDDDDTFILTGLEDLVPVKGETIGGVAVTTYLPRTEGSFSWIRHFVAGVADWWLVIDRNNVSRWYGAYPDDTGEVLATPDDPVIRHPDRDRHIFSWLLAEERDDRGNRTRFRYKAEDEAGIDPLLPWEQNRPSHPPVQYIKHIDFTRLPPGNPSNLEWGSRLTFDYGEHDAADPALEDVPWQYRADPFSSYRSGFDLRIRRLCQRVLHFSLIPEANAHSLTLNAATELAYDDADGLSKLAAALHRRFVWDGAAYQSDSLPEAKFIYSKPEVSSRIRRVASGDVAGTPSGLIDEFRFIDLEGESLAGILSEQGAEWYFRENLGNASFGVARSIDRPGGVTLAEGGQVAALESDGRPYLYSYGSSGGYAERKPDGGWDEFVAFPEQPNIDWADANLRWLDLNGDGIPEVVIFHDEVIEWHRNQGKRGIAEANFAGTGADQRKGPARLFHNTLESIFTADMSGDGLTDIVRIRNGQTCYWPNLGYGRFGPQVEMGSSPWFTENSAFDPAQVQLADIDGSGTTDVLYLDGSSTRFWINRAGNFWSGAHSIPQTPPTDRMSQVGMVDLLGNGTNCLVWSSKSPADAHSPWRYIELMVDRDLRQADVRNVPTSMLATYGVQATVDERADLSLLDDTQLDQLEAAGAMLSLPSKPYLLREIDNGAGLITRLGYKPSTHFYLQDRKAGTPWITKLPFCVHVVDRQEIIDQVTSSRFVKRLSYHHGYYDRFEREFRGFGRVDHWDMEAVGDNTQDLLNRTPILTRTWFHTGGFPGTTAISAQFAHEYYALPGGLSLPDSAIENEAGLTVDELRQARRVLRGQTLRSEVFACKPFAAGADLARPDGAPYQVTEQRFRVRKWSEPKLRGDHGIFFSHPEEALSVVCETDAADPRVAHELTLAVDKYGQPIQSAKVAYGRNVGSAGAMIEQTRTHISVIQASLANNPRATDWHRLGTPISLLGWELGNDHDFAASGCSSPSQLRDFFAANPVPVVSKQLALAPGERRLLSASVQLYRGDADLDLGAAPLDLGVVHSLALSCRSYALTMSPADVDDGDGNFTTADFTDGKYVDPLDLAAFPEHQTLAGFQAFLLALPDVRMVAGFSHAGWWARDNETALSQQDFYAPIEVRDAWGNVTAITMDSYALAALKVTNPLGHETHAEIDYRLMAPRRVTDPIGTQQSARFDIFGRPIQIAITGALGEGDALDSLTTFDPASSATSWVHYEFFGGPGKPAHVHTWTRETHHADLNPGDAARWMETRTYTDGLGRDVLAKAKVAAGHYDFDSSGNPGNSSGAPRWVGSGRTVFDNKGNPVLQYEPYFAKDVDYGDGAPQHGVTPILHYDPMERVVMTELPDGTTTRVSFTAWEQRSFDALDTFDPIRSPQYDPVDPGHIGSPQVQYLDSLGRPFRTEVTNFDPVSGTSETYVSQIEYDFAGNPLRTIDAKGQLALKQWFDRAGRPLKSVSNDAGTGFALLALDGQPAIQILPNGHRAEQRYDAFRRPTELWVTEPGGAPSLREAIVYADNQPGVANGKGKPWRVFDPCGMIETPGYDFKGVPISTSRHVLGSLMNATSPPPDVTDWSGHDLTTSLSLFGESYATASLTNALGSPIEASAPDGSVQRFGYDEGGALSSIVLDNLPGKSGPQQVVQSVTHDAQGRRSHIAYGNGTETAYAYDPLTFRLTRLTTTRGSDVLQDMAYRYDPLGNIVRITDLAQDAVIQNNQSIAPTRTYVYDSIARLVRADGREHVGQTQPDQRFRPDGLTPANASDIGGLRSYSERWLFDAIGNIERWEHSGTDAGQTWARDYIYASAGNNRLTATMVSIGGTPQATAYSYDVAGNLTAFGHLTQSRWNVDNQPEDMTLHGNVIARYRYDAGGERMLKRIEKPGGQVAIRLYLGGFEIYREFSAAGALTLRRDSLHLIDGTSRILMIETEKSGDDVLAALTPVQRWQIGDHLRSCALELDGAGAVLSYEEYHAYGTSSWHWTATGISQKRYRYTGMERDEESGLHYHSARYYLPWLGRWLSCDPLGMVDGPSLWAYARGNPVALSDRGGGQSAAAIEDEPIGVSDKRWQELSEEQRKSGHYFRRLNEVTVFGESKAHEKIREEGRSSGWAKVFGSITNIVIGVAMIAEAIATATVAATAAVAFGAAVALTGGLLLIAVAVVVTAIGTQQIVYNNKEKAKISTKKDLVKANRQFDEEAGKIQKFNEINKIAGEVVAEITTDSAETHAAVAASTKLSMDIGGTFTGAELPKKSNGQENSIMESVVRNPETAVTVFDAGKDAVTVGKSNAESDTTYTGNSFVDIAEIPKIKNVKTVKNGATKLASKNKILNKIGNYFTKPRPHYNLNR